MMFRHVDGYLFRGYVGGHSHKVFMKGSQMILTKRSS